MQTNIALANRISKKENTVYLIKSYTDLKKYPFSDEEIDFIKTQIKKRDQSFFSFNRLQKWDFVHVFSKTDYTPENVESYRKAGDKLLSDIHLNNISQITLIDSIQFPQGVIAFAEGMALGNYQFLKYKNKEQKKSINSLHKINIFSKSINPKLVHETNILVEAVYITRNLVNEPVSFLNAEKLAAEAKRVCTEAGAKVEVLNKIKIETLKMGGLLAVNKGSIDPPTFTIIEWKPAHFKNKKPYVFVGKGIVMDTGGINLKPGSSMQDMKCDMSGAAAVIGAIYAIAKTKLPVHVIGLIPATDNRIDAGAQVPGDIITMHNGTTVEVLNTDAEGRLILADALSFAKKYNPELVIDIATLTGSAHAAIGSYGMVGMGKNYKNYMEELKISGEKEAERIVEFPLWDDYNKLVESDMADLKNIGGANAGAITAGIFLSHFTNYPWIHLDIAGPAYLDTRNSYRGKGGTGWGVRILFRFLKDNCKN